MGDRESTWPLPMPMSTPPTSRWHSGQRPRASARRFGTATSGFAARRPRRSSRRRGNICDFSVTSNRLAIGIMRLYARYLPTVELVNQVVKTDTSNRHYLKHLDESIWSPKQQEKLRQQHDDDGVWTQQQQRQEQAL